MLNNITLLLLVSLYIYATSADRISVLESQEYAPQFVSLSGQPEVVLAMKPHTFECVADSVPAPEIRWFKNDVLLPETHPNHFTQLGSELLFLHVHQTDAGLYHCEAANRLGAAISARVPLIVQPDNTNNSTSTVANNPNQVAGVGVGPGVGLGAEAGSGSGNGNGNGNEQPLSTPSVLLQALQTTLGALVQQPAALACLALLAALAALAKIVFAVRRCAKQNAYVKHDTHYTSDSSASSSLRNALAGAMTTCDAIDAPQPLIKPSDSSSARVACSLIDRLLYSTNNTSNNQNSQAQYVVGRSSNSNNNSHHLVAVPVADQSLMAPNYHVLMHQTNNNSSILLPKLQANSQMLLNSNSCSSVVVGNTYWPPPTSTQAINSSQVQAHTQTQTQTQTQTHIQASSKPASLCSFRKIHHSFAPQTTHETPATPATSDLQNQNQKPKTQKSVWLRHSKVAAVDQDTNTNTNSAQSPLVETLISPYAVSSICDKIPQQQQTTINPQIAHKQQSSTSGQQQQPPINAEALEALKQQLDMSQMFFSNEQQTQTQTPLLDFDPNLHPPPPPPPPPAIHQVATNCLRPELNTLTSTNNINNNSKDVTKLPP